MSTRQCPLCDSPDMQPFAAFENVPPTGILYRQREQSIPHRSLVFDYCTYCAFIYQRPGLNQPIDYSEVSRPTTTQLPAYAQALIEQLKAFGLDGLTVEVGCNDGTFLDHLRVAGFGTLLGIEPSTTLVTQAREKGHQVEALPLDLATAQEVVSRHGLAQRLVCRHTLEHVPDPLAFLKAVRSLMQEGGLACIEVPSALPIIQDLHVHEIWDEHVSYFLPENLHMTLRMAGFKVERLHSVPYREMQNIVMWARAADVHENIVPASAQRLQQCASFNQHWQARAEQLVKQVAASPSPRVAMGASHPQANFLNFSGLSHLIDCVIDDDPSKQNKWLPLCGNCVPIHPGSTLVEKTKGGTLLLTGFGYPGWMDKATQAVAGSAAVCIDIAEYSFEMQS